MTEEKKTEEKKTDEKEIDEKETVEAQAKQLIEDKMNNPGSVKDSVSVEEEVSTPQSSKSLKEDAGGGGKTPPPDFSSFIFSISTTVLMDLGEIEHPIDKEKKVNLKMAKHSIDILDMLKEKTKGNLAEQETTLLENIVADLKLRYFKKTS